VVGCKISSSTRISCNRKLNLKFLQYNSQRYHPAWSSLARDYLAVMSSSVSSERTFSQGGITISKRRNCLKGDIVEALLCVKSAIHHHLLFREPAPSSRSEIEETTDGELENAGEECDDSESENSCDGLLIEDDEDMDAIYF
jgi:hAT family C-terminal dimerisation region